MCSNCNRLTTTQMTALQSQQKPFPQMGNKHTRRLTPMLIADNTPPMENKDTTRTPLTLNKSEVKMKGPIIREWTGTADLLENEFLCPRKPPDLCAISLLQLC